MAAKSIVILGGGVGGIVVANRLRSRLSAEHRVVVIEKSAEHAFAPSFLWLMTGDRRPDQVRRPLKSLLSGGVELRIATAEGIDLKARKVQTSAGNVEFEYLIIALGAELAPESISGLAESSETFYTASGAARLHERLESFQGGRIALVVASLPYKCPAAPYEGAMLIADYLRRRNLRDKADIHLFTPEALPMPVAGPVLGQAVRELLESEGITLHPGHVLTNVNPRTKSIAFQQTTAQPFDLVVAIPPHRAPALLWETGLVNAAGWVIANPQTLETSFERVFALGDVTAMPIPGRWKPDVPLMLPKAGVFAHVQAEVVAAHIVGDIEGRSAPDTFSGHGYCMLEAGEHMAGFASGNFFAEPAPSIQLPQTGHAWHLGKVLLEKWWLSRPGWKRGMYAAMLKTGGKVYRVPVAV